MVALVLCDPPLVDVGTSEAGLYRDRDLVHELDGIVGEVAGALDADGLEKDTHIGGAQ